MRPRPTTHTGLLLRRAPVPGIDIGDVRFFLLLLASFAVRARTYHNFEVCIYKSSLVLF